MTDQHWANIIGWLRSKGLQLVVTGRAYRLDRATYSAPRYKRLAWLEATRKTPA